MFAALATRRCTRSSPTSRASAPLISFWVAHGNAQPRMAPDHGALACRRYIAARELAPRTRWIRPRRTFFSFITQSSFSRLDARRRRTIKPAESDSVTDLRAQLDQLLDRVLRHVPRARHQARLAARGSRCASPASPPRSKPRRTRSPPAGSGSRPSSAPCPSAPPKTRFSASCTARTKTRSPAPPTPMSPAGTSVSGPMCRNSSLMKPGRNASLRYRDLPLGLKSDPPLPPPIGSVVRLFLNTCSNARNFNMPRFTDG